MTTDIGWTGVVGSLVLIVLAVGLSRRRRLGLEGSLLWAAARAVVQLSAVGVVLAFILGAGRSTAYAWAWVALMVGVAAVTVRLRAPEVPSVLGLATAALGLAVTVTLAVAFGLGVFPLQSRAILPLAGMIIGNSMAATVVAARRIVAELSDKRDEVEARLALGCAGPEAARPYVRAALRTALLPQIETTKVLGLIALPGMMTGLILAGVDPADAVRVQAAIMFLILGSVATTTTVMALGLIRRLFTPDHRLVRPALPVLPVPAGRRSLLARARSLGR
ncbi:MAG: ABC transporter permease [Acidimicrobiia bacterium]